MLDIIAGSANHEYMIADTLLSYDTNCISGTSRMIDFIAGSVSHGHW